MKSFLKTNELIEALNNRYAVKKFEKRNLYETEKSELEDTVKSILQLTPTSFWLQAYKCKKHRIKRTIKKIFLGSVSNNWFWYTYSFCCPYKFW